MRGFFYPRGADPSLGATNSLWARYEDGGPAPPPGAHRWTRDLAWIRMFPTVPAAAYDITIEMGSPFPSPVSSPRVTLTGNDGVAHALTLGPVIRPFTLRVGDVAPGAPLVVRLDSPVWSRLGEPADQGVRVDRMAVRPAGNAR